MRSEEVIEVINVICDRLGLAVDSATEIIPELARREITIGLFWVVSSIVIIVLSIKAIRFVTSKKKKDLKFRERESLWSANYDNYEYVTIVSFVAGASIIVFILVCILQIRKYPFTEIFLKFTVWRGACKGIIS